MDVVQQHYLWFGSGRLCLLRMTPTHSTNLRCARAGLLSYTFGSHFPKCVDNLYGPALALDKLEVPEIFEAFIQHSSGHGTPPRTGACFDLTCTTSSSVADCGTEAAAPHPRFEISRPCTSTNTSTFWISTVSAWWRVDPEDRDQTRVSLLIFTVAGYYTGRNVKYPFHLTNKMVLLMADTRITSNTESIPRHLLCTASLQASLGYFVHYIHQSPRYQIQCGDITAVRGSACRDFEVLMSTVKAATTLSEQCNKSMRSWKFERLTRIGAET